MEREPRRPEGRNEQQIDASAALPIEEADELPPSREERIIDEGIEYAVDAGKPVEDWVARQIALTAARSAEESARQALSVFADTGELLPGLRGELASASEGQTRWTRRAIEALAAYADSRQDAGPVNAWAEQAEARDRFDAAWRAVGPWERRAQTAMEISQSVQRASVTGRIIGDDVAMRIMVDIASSTHDAIARFTAEGAVTDELREELAQKYQLRDPQMVPWLDQLGRWIVAKTGVSPDPERWPMPAASAVDATRTGKDSEAGIPRNDARDPDAPREPRRPDWDEPPRPPVEDLDASALLPGQAQRIIQDGIRIARDAGQDIDDWVARHIALRLRDEESSGLDVFVRTGEISRDLLAELARAYLKALPLRRWIEALHGYATHRTDRGPVDGWAGRARARDQFHTARWDKDRHRGDRYLEGRELDGEIRLAQEARVVIGDELAMRLLVRLAPNAHSAVARFAADGQVTDELSRELQDRYLSGTEQERRWLNELGTWLANGGKPSPVPWWRSPAPVDPAVAEQADPERDAEHRAARLVDLDERLAPLPDLGDIPRPPQGHSFGDGYEWMNEGLPEGWHPESIWGRDGWNLGDWPLVVVALYADDAHENYAVATYVEGDVDVRRYKSRGALYVAVNGIAEWHWRFGQSRGPRDLPEGRGLLARHTGPYPGWRDGGDTAS